MTELNSVNYNQAGSEQLRIMTISCASMGATTLKLVEVFDCASTTLLLLLTMLPAALLQGVT